METSGWKYITLYETCLGFWIETDMLIEIYASVLRLPWVGRLSFDSNPWPKRPGGSLSKCSRFKLVSNSSRGEWPQCSYTPSVSCCYSTFNTAPIYARFTRCMSPGVHSRRDWPAGDARSHPLLLKGACMFTVVFTYQFTWLLWSSLTKTWAVCIHLDLNCQKSPGGCSRTDQDVHSNPSPI